MNKIPLETKIDFLGLGGLPKPFSTQIEQRYTVDMQYKDTDNNIHNCIARFKVVYVFDKISTESVVKELTIVDKDFPETKAPEEVKKYTQKTLQTIINNMPIQVIIER